MTDFKVPDGWGSFGLGEALDELEVASRPLRAYKFGVLVGKTMIICQCDEQEACHIVHDTMDSVQKAVYAEIIGEGVDAE
jgi:hypothetical protein